MSDDGKSESRNGSSRNLRKKSPLSSPRLSPYNIPGSSSLAAPVLRLQRDKSMDNLKTVLSQSVGTNKRPFSSPISNGSSTDHVALKGSNTNGVPLLQDEASFSASSSKQTNFYFTKRASSTFTLFGLESLLDERGHRHLVGRNVSAHKSQEIHKILDDYVQYKKQEPSFRQKIFLLMNASFFGRIYELFDVLLNTAFCVIYVINIDFREKVLASGFDSATFEFFLIIVMIVFWIPKIMFNKDVFDYLRSYFAIAALLSYFPPLFCYMFIPGFWTIYTAGGDWTYLMPFRFIHLYQCVMNLLVPSQNSLFKASDIRRKAYRLFVIILFILLTGAALFHVVEFMDKDRRTITFFDAFWFITLSTTSGLPTGVTTSNPFSRIVILYVMALGLILIPVTLSEILTLIRLQSKYIHSYKPMSNDRHVLVIGKFDHNSLQDFFVEFFSLDHGYDSINTKIIILNPDEPDDKLSALLGDPIYIDRVQYVKGTSISFRQLQKCKANRAEACFVLSPKFATKPLGEDDAEAVMRSLVIKRFNPSIRLHVQVLHPENKTHFGLLAEHLLCVDEIRLGLFANNCMAPGFSTLVHLLTTSMTDDAFKVLRSFVKRNQKSKWILDYMKGATQEFYETRFAANFTGLSFLEAADTIYQRVGAVLFAVGIKRIHGGGGIRSSVFEDDSDYHLVLNPGNYKIQGNEIAFLIAADRQMATQVERMNDVEKEENPLEGLKEYFADSPASETAPLLETLTIDIKEDLNHNVSDSTEIFDNHAANAPESLNNSKPDKSNNAFRSGTSRKRGTGKSKTTKGHQLSGSVLPGTYELFHQVKQDINFFREAFFRDKQIGQDSGNTKGKKELPNTVYEHILVCDTGSRFPYNLDCLIGPLRGHHVDMKPAIVILSPSEPSAEEYEYLNKYENVYFINGSALDKKALVRAGVERAAKAVVLSNSDNYERIKMRVSDSSTLFAILNIEAMAPSCFISAELLHAENMKFLGDSDNVLRENFSTITNQVVLSAPFVSGHVSSPWMLDTLLCQSYYKPHLLNILKQLLFSSTQERILSATDFGGIEQGHVFQVPVPKELVGCIYSSCFKYFARLKGAICIGLYKSLEGSAGDYFVIPNPHGLTMLDEDDFIYVLSHRQPIFPA